ncbi:MAG TPA: hypothetical protein P5116_01335 [Eubacteriales bacterium]|nr:hypothetical protein [Bacillota bacterium]HRV72506.1 hypothetical protein [Eubacteriales bacterium]
MLDAMKIQIESIKQQYLKALVVQPDPEVKMVTTNRSNICYTAKLQSEQDIDNYLASVKEKLMDMLEGNDALHII